jgi:cell division protein FtsB
VELRDRNEDVPGLDPHEAFDWMESTPPRFLRRHAERVAHRRRMHRLLTGMAVAVLAWGFVLADGGLVSIVSRRARIRQLTHHVEALEQRHVWLQEEIGRRQKDRATIERIAREQYGLIYPGETIYRIREIDEAAAQRIESEQAARLRTEPDRPTESPR